MNVHTSIHVYTDTVQLQPAVVLKGLTQKQILLSQVPTQHMQQDHQKPATAMSRQEHCKFKKKINLS